MIFNGFRVVGVFTEVVIDVVALTIVDFPRLHRNILTVVAALDPKQVVSLSGKC